MPVFPVDQTTDALVIGSGYGGAVSALRLAQDGKTVRVLERGAWWVPRDRPDRPMGSDPAPWQVRGEHIFPTLWSMDARAAWRSKSSPLDGPVHVGTTLRPGMYERVETHHDSRSPMAVIAAAAVGGGSVANGAMMLRATQEEWAEVFDEALVPWAEIDEAYRTVKQVMGFQRPSESFEPTDLLALMGYPQYRDHLEFQRQANAAGLGTKMVHTAVDWPRILKLLQAHERGDGELPWAARGEYLIGSRDDIKLSLDKNYLPAALATGRCEVRSLTEVYRIRKAGDLWEVDAAPLNENGERTASVTFRARRVFCCAGSMGTTRLLLRSRETVPGLQTLHAEGGLGTHWGNNGDVLLRRVGVLAAVAGRAGGPSLFSFHGAGTAKHPFQVRVVHTPGPDVIDWSFVQLAMAPVAATGRFEWDAEANDWRLKWDANAGGGGRPSSDDIDAAARALLNRLPGSAFSVLGNSSGATFHPLGGCVLGVGTERDGQVRHCPGLHVIDSALIPGHTGGNNPAWTVAALAEVVIRRVIGA